MNFVADTHALLWWFTNSPKISPKASEVFEKCEAGEYIIFIPSIVIAEALSIFDKKRITLNLKTYSKKLTIVKILCSLHLTIVFSKKWWP